MLATFTMNAVQAAVLVLPQVVPRLTGAVHGHIFTVVEIPAPTAAA